jgi:hypothetical protein
MIESEGVLVGAVLSLVFIVGVFIYVQRTSKPPDFSRLEKLGPVNPEDPVMSAIHEAEFHLAYGLKDEARAVIEREIKRHPGDARLLNKRQELAG